MEKQVIQSVGFRNIYDNGKAVGFQLKLRLPYTRGVFLSQIKPGSLTVDGETFAKEQVIWRINGEDYTAEGMRQNWHTHWHPLEPAILIVKKEGGLCQGYHDIQYGFCVTHSYMPPEMEKLSDPEKQEIVYFPEFGHNQHKRRMLIV